MQGGNGDTNIEKRLVDPVGEGEGGKNGESSMETYTRPHAREMASGNLLYDAGSSNRGSVST